MTPQRFSEGTGISAPLSEDVNLLGGILGEVVARLAGQPVYELVEELRRLCKEASTSGDAGLRAQAATLIGAQDPEALRWVLQAYVAFFHLANQAEKQEILRINRERSRALAAGEERPESIGDAVARLAASGCSLAQVLARVRRLDLQPTLTAHPSEARRHSVLQKQRRIAELLAELRATDPNSEAAAVVTAAIREQVALLLATEEVRTARPTVAQEVTQGIYFLSTSIWTVVPRIHQDLARALEHHYGYTGDVPVVLRFRSWIGGDRDGNPNVTAEVTRDTLHRHRLAALQLHLQELRALRAELSISDRAARPSDALLSELGRLEGDAPPDPAEHGHEPYRRLLAHVAARLERLRGGAADGEPAGQECYDAAAYLRHLELVRDSLRTTGFDAVARGRVARMVTLARTFGFHLAALDIRQHSRIHEQAVAALLRAAGISPDYAALAEPERLALLERLLHGAEPLPGPGAAVPADAAPVLDTFAEIRRAQERDSDSIGSYIISMTHQVSDVLEPMLLARAAGLLRVHGDALESTLDFVPLFETIADLASAPERMSAIFAHPVYRQQLAARGHFQEIMLGYSDSNKDGGYWMANWALHQAHDRLARVCRAQHVDCRFFHGRGGTVGRGGGRANRAIAAMPRSAQNGRMRLTEQGEVISFRYGLTGLAHRHTEQLVSALLLATAVEEPGEVQPLAPAGGADLMETVARESMTAYRALIDHPRFWPWFTQVTPVEHISRLPLASRPASRKGAAEAELEDLRAIPWVFSWTQTRYNVPGWFGSGGPLARAAADPHTLELLQRLYRDWPFLRALIQNAALELARTRLEIAAAYAQLAERDVAFHDEIAADFRRTRTAVLRIARQNELLDDTPVIRRSIGLRNPYTDVINLVQLELLRRQHRDAAAARQAPPGAGAGSAELAELLFLSINGIAAATQTTG